MLKALLKTKLGDLLVIGLSQINTEKLLEGLPIVFNLSELGLPPQMVLIMGGETEGEMKADLEARVAKE